MPTLNLVLIFHFEGPVGSGRFQIGLWAETISGGRTLPRPDLRARSKNCRVENLFRSSTNRSSPKARPANIQTMTSLAAPSQQAGSSHHTARSVLAARAAPQRPIRWQATGWRSWSDSNARRGQTKQHSIWVHTAQGKECGLDDSFIVVTEVSMNNLIYLVGLVVVVVAVLSFFGLR